MYLHFMDLNFPTKMSVLHIDEAGNSSNDYIYFH